MPPKGKSNFLTFGPGKYLVLRLSPPLAGDYASGPFGTGRIRIQILALPQSATQRRGGGKNSFFNPFCYAAMFPPFGGKNGGVA